MPIIDAHGGDRRSVFHFSFSERPARGDPETPPLPITMTTAITIEADADGKTLEVLSDLIAKRQQYLKGETTESAVIATAINVTTSLRADTKQSPKKARGDEYTIEEIGIAGWRGGKDKTPRRRTALVGGHHVPGVFPVNQMYGLKGDGKYFKITLLNPRIQPKKAKNSPVYLILAPTLDVAKNFANKLVGNVLKKESGLAKYALGIAASQISNRPATGDQSLAPRPKQVAAGNVNVAKKSKGGVDSGYFSVSVEDNLSYSALAFNSPSALNSAMQKAANRTAAIINRLAAYKLDEPIPTPFPEIAGK